MVNYSDVMPTSRIGQSNIFYECQTKNIRVPDQMSDRILYSYFIALREIYQNVYPKVPGNPRDVIFPDAEGGGKYNNSGIPGNQGTNVLVYFPKSIDITVMLHFTRENAWKIDPKF